MSIRVYDGRKGLPRAFGFARRHWKVVVPLTVLLVGGVAFGTLRLLEASADSGRVRGAAGDVAVIEFDVQSLMPNRNAGGDVAQKLIAAIRRLTGNTVVPSPVLHADLEEQRLIKPGEVVSRSVAQRVARKLGVNTIIWGTVSIGDGSLLTAHSLDRDRGWAISTGNLSTESAGEMGSRVGVVAYQLLGSTKRLRNVPPVAQLGLERSQDTRKDSASELVLFRDEEITLNGASSQDEDGRIVRYEWDLNGDGVPDELGQNAKTRSASQTPGQGAVTLTVEDDAGARSTATVRLTVLGETYRDFRVARQIPPVARILVKRQLPAGQSPSDILLGEPLTLDATSSYAAGGSIAKYEWDLNSDGIADASGQVLKTGDLSAVPGLATASLRVTDDIGLVASASSAVVVSKKTYEEFLRETNIPPVARLRPVRALEYREAVKGQLTTLFLSEEFTMSASDSYDPDGAIVQYEWDLNGDGTIEEYGKTIDGSLISHQSGRTTVTVYVVDNLGARSESEVEVRVLGETLEQRVAARGSTILIITLVVSALVGLLGYLADGMRHERRTDSISVTTRPASLGRSKVSPGLVAR